MRIFIRDDDLGWEPDRFAELLELHERRGLRLNAAAIPEAAKAAYRPSHFASAAGLLEIHTHGFQHANHASEGKKIEFGAREPADVAVEIAMGKAALEKLFPENFFPAFVPPWNRMDARWTELLAVAGYRVLSRFQGAAPVGIKGLLELDPSVDLHTRKAGPWTSVGEVLDAIESEGARGGPAVGIMIHHNRIGAPELKFLDELYAELARSGHSAHFLSEFAEAKYG